MFFFSNKLLQEFHTTHFEYYELPLNYRSLTINNILILKFSSSSFVLLALVM